MHTRVAAAVAADGARSVIGAAGVGKRRRRAGKPPAQRRCITRRRSIWRVQRALPGACRSPAGSLQTAASRGAGWGYASGSQVRRDHCSHLRPPNAHCHPHAVPLSKFQNSQRKFWRYSIHLKLLLSSSWMYKTCTLLEYRMLEYRNE